MSHNTKALSGGSISGRAGSLGSLSRGAFAPRGVRGNIDGSGACAGLRVLALFCLAVSAALALTATPVLAAENHFLSSSFGEPGSGNGQFALGEHSSLAVNQASGDIYVTDTGNGRVQEFSSTGTFVRAFGSLTTPTLIAIDNSPGASKGAIYVVDSSNNTISKFSSTGVFQSAWATNGILSGGAEPFGELAGIAVDAAGDLNVIQIDSEPHHLLRFDQAGDLVATIEIPRGNAVAGLAIDTEGNFYKVDGNPEVTKFTPSGENLGEPDASGDNQALATDPASGGLFAIHGSGGYVSRYALNCGQACAPAESFGEAELTNPRAVAVGAGGRTYVADAASNEIAIFTTALVPNATTEAPDEVERNTATLHATVGAAGGPAASCEFQYLTDAKFQAEGFAAATSVPCNPTGPFTGTAPQAVKAEIAGLQVGTFYDFRIVAKNANGTNAGARFFFGTRAPLSLETQEATNTSTISTTLNGQVNPEGLELEECFFEYVLESAYSAEGFASAQKVLCAETPAQIGKDEAQVPVHADLTGLNPNTFYRFRVGAKNSTGTVTSTRDENVETLGPPTITGEGSAEVSLTTGKIVGTINPHGIATSFQVQYVSAVQFDASGYAEASSIPIPAEEIGGGRQPIEVTQPLIGLSAGTTYHFRIVATNAGGPPVFGADLSFTTFAVVGTGLPDNRAYEMVSPAQKRGGEVIPGEVNRGAALGVGCIGSPEGYCLPGTSLSTFLPLESSDDGNRIVFFGQPFSGEFSTAANQYRAMRSSSGWETESLSPREAGGGSGQGYKQFAQGLNRAVLLQIDSALGPDAPSEGNRGYANLYLTEDGRTFRPLLTSKPPNRLPGQSGEAFVVNYAGANTGTETTPPLEHVIFSADDSLTSAVSGIAPAAPQVGASGCGSEQNCNLYEAVGGELRLVNVLPGNDQAVEDGNFGSANSGIGDQGIDFDHAISADGSRIFWSRRGDGQVFVRIDGRETQQVADPGEYVTASTDGRKVLLNDGCIYSFDSAACATDLSQGQGGFKGILGASDDLERVYYVDTAPLTGTEENVNGERASADTDNLYLWDEGSTKFIATLLPSDNEAGKIGDWKSSSSSRSAQVTPDGRFLAFMSGASLTGYDNARAGEARASMARASESKRVCAERCLSTIWLLKR